MPELGDMIWNSGSVESETKCTSGSSVFFDCFDDLFRAVNPQAFTYFAVLVDGELLLVRSRGGPT